MGCASYRTDKPDPDEAACRGAALLTARSRGLGSLVTADVAQIVPGDPAVAVQDMRTR